MNSEFSIKLNWTPGRHDSAARWVLSHVLRNKFWIVTLLIGAIGNGLGASLMFVFIGQAFNAVSQPPINYALIGTAAIGIAVSQIVRGILQLGRNFGSEVIGQRLERDARHELYASLIGKSMTFHDQQTVGDVMARATNDVREVNLMMNPGLNLVVGSGMFLIVPLFVVPTLHPALIAVPLIYIIAYFITLQRYLNQLQPATENVRRQFGDMNAVLAESIEGIETVKGAAQEEQAIEKFESGAGAYRDAYVRQGFIEARFIPLLLLGLANALGLAHSLILFRQGLINIGDVVAFNGQLLLFGFPTFTSAFAYPQIASGLSSARRILALINAQSDLDENRAGHAGEMKGAIQFDHVTFNYRSDTPVLDDVSFEARPGQTIAIVGQTGSGKTSIIKLLNRIYDTNAGRVLIDGVDVRDWQLAALRPQISIIEQDFVFVLAHDCREHQVWQLQRHAGTGGSGRESGAGARFRHELCRRLQHHRRRARRDPIGRAAATDCAGAGAVDRSEDFDPRRRDQRHRQRHRRSNSASHLHRRARPHHHPDHASPVADSLGGCDRRHARRQSRGHRLAR